MIERELQQGQREDFDLLIIDAFSGDAIPIHLLTQQAFDLYLERLKPDGVLVFHITNRHVDLSDLLRNMARESGHQTFLVMNDPESSFDSDWVLITKNQAFIERIGKSDRLAEWLRPEPKKVQWTDDYSNLFEVLY